MKYGMSISGQKRLQILTWIVILLVLVTCVSIFPPAKLRTLQIGE